MIDKKKPSDKAEEINEGSNLVSQSELEKQLEAVQKENRKLKEQFKMFHSFQVVAQHTSSSVVIVDVEGSVVWTNQSFERLAGYKLNEIRGKTPSRFLMGEDMDLEKLQNMLNMMQLKQSFAYDVQHYNSRGEPYQIIVNGEPIFDDDGNLYGYAMLETDITLLKMIEKSLTDASQAAEENEMAKASFLANLSHELNTPLNGILGITQLFKSTPLTKEQTEYLHLIQESGESLVSLIKKLLSLTEVSKPNNKTELTDIRASLKRLVARFWPECQTKKLLFNLQVDEDIPISLYLPWVKLSSALTHLCDNAVKFTPSGRLDLIVSHWGNSSLKFKVKDSGPGISAEFLPYIFDEFYQADSSFTRDYQGAGLGLAIAKNMVESFGSQIEVETILGEGSSFSFTVPYQPDSLSNA